MDEFVDKKKEEYQKQNLCLNQNDSSSIPWQHINVYETKEDKIMGKKALFELPYYQVIQQSSPSGYGHETQGSRTDGWGAASHRLTNYDGRNIKVDNDQFTLFSTGLNYMFYADNMGEDMDNIFIYNDAQLAAMNYAFH
jgi:hypothetical protein